MVNNLGQCEEKEEDTRIHKLEHMNVQLNAVSRLPHPDMPVSNLHHNFPMNNWCKKKI